MTYTVKNHYLDRDETADTMLEILEDCQIFAVSKKGDGFEIIEKCDGYFGVSLNKDQMLALSNEIKDLANNA